MLQNPALRGERTDQEPAQTAETGRCLQQKKVAELTEKYKEK